MKAIVVAALVLVGCSAFPKVVVEKTPVECVVPLAAVEPVAMPAALPLGSTNEDLRNREQRLEGALEKANARLAAVPGLVNTTPAKPAEEPKGFWSRLFK